MRNTYTAAITTQRSSAMLSHQKYRASNRVTIHPQRLRKARVPSSRLFFPITIV